ncbi:hypothetical protein DYB25_003450 [Aphanomyces astaci]|uniref:UVR domain-containing protein n=2 Tax=Aphanomyces astaci TaxID=112090 RepID=A0A397BMD2_APHAT|nr:hypothetical protein DYB25_003450 [Aphanomyces astaci]
MLGRFFTKKDESKSSRPPHAVGPPQPRPVATEDSSGGGGFFNLPPPASGNPTSSLHQPGGFTNPNNVSYNHSPAKVPTLGGGSQPPPPASGGLNPNNPYQRPHTSAPPSLFGGMSVKSSSNDPPVAIPGSIQPVHPDAKPLSLFGGLELGGSAAATSSAAVNNTPSSNPSPLSLSALNLPTATPIPTADAPVKRSQRGSSGFNYLDVAPPDASTTSAAPTAVALSSTAVPVVKKKKKPTFRPGFGRQLSDESAAALQRGDLKDEDIVPDVPSTSPPITPTPPSTKSTSSSSSSSILGGLKLHTPAADKPIPTLGRKGSSTLSAALPAEDLSSLLANMTIRNFATNTATTIPSLVKAHSQRASMSPRGSPSNFDVAATSFRNGLAQLKGEASHIVERRTMLAKQIAQFNLDLHEVEASQVQAAEDEDFERADALNATIEKLRHCLMLSQSDLRKCEQDSVGVTKQTEKLVLQHVRSAKGTWNNLSKLDDERTAALATLKAQAKAFKATERRRFAFEKQRVATELHHVTVNMDHLDSEKAEIEAAIASQCTDEYAAREHLVAEQAAVAADIAALEAKLAACRAHMAELDAGLAKADQGIQLVRQKFSRQLKRLVEREKSILKTRKEVEADEAAMHRAQEGFEAAKADFAGQLAALAGQAASVRRDLRVAAIVVRVAEEQNSTRQAKEDRVKRMESQLASLRDQVQEAEKQWALVKHQHADLSAKLTGFRTLIMTAGTTLPLLEADKKQAAADRNFKEAARLSKDIKQLEKDRAGADEQIEVLGMEIQDVDALIVDKEAAFTAATAAFQGAEKELELEALQGLYDVHHDLRVVLRQLTSEDPSRAKTDAAEVVAPSLLRPIALALVQSEFDHVVAEIEVLEDKYLLEPYVKPLEPPDEVDDASGLVTTVWSDSDDDDMEDDKEGPGPSGESAPPKAARLVEVGAGRSGSAAVHMTPAALAAKIADVEGQIQVATDEEDYELAAQLDEQLEMWVARLAALEAEQAQAPSEVDLRAELEELQHAIEALAGQIEHATDEEEYEIAAHLDEDLVAAQTRKTEIQLQLAAMEGPVVDDDDGSTHHVLHDDTSDGDHEKEDEEDLDEQGPTDEASPVHDENTVPEEDVESSTEHAAAEVAEVAEVSAEVAEAAEVSAEVAEVSAEVAEVSAEVAEVSAEFSAEVSDVSMGPVISLFAGLHTVEMSPTTESEGRGLSLIEGLAEPAPAALAPASATSSSLFGGLTVAETAAVVALPEQEDDVVEQVQEKEEDEEADEGPEEVAADEDEEATLPVKEESDDDAKDASDDEHDEGVLVDDEPVEETEGDIEEGDEDGHDGAAVEGPSVPTAAAADSASDSAVEVDVSPPTSSLFGGLSLGTPVVVDSDQDEPSSGAPTTTSTASLFGGLSLQPTAPVSIVTLDNALEGPRSPTAFGSLFGGLSFSAPPPPSSSDSVPAAIAVGASSSLFGGLSLASGHTAHDVPADEAPVQALDAPIDLTAAAAVVE